MFEIITIALFLLLSISMSTVGKTKPYPTKTYSTMLKRIKNNLKTSYIIDFQYIFNPKLTWIERFLWLILNVILFTLTLMLINYTFKDFFTYPLVTSFETGGHPIQKVNFPAVAVCNLNKISKKRAINYADTIAVRTGIASDWILNYIKTLGKFYGYDGVSSKDFLAFQTIIEKHSMKDFINVYNATENNYLYYIARNLSTPCEELIMECKWDAKVKNCSKMFTLHRTYMGFCCIFNYARENDKFISYNQKDKQPIKPTKSGWNYGLRVKIKNEPEDYFYTLLPSIGASILIFDPYDFPDEPSGGLVHELVGINTEILIDVAADVLYTVPEVRKYSLPIRKCLFENEVSTIFGKYSLSNCIVQCRVESIIALCNCIPLLTVPKVANTTQCTLSDISCLNKYQEKWRTLYPYKDDFNDLAHEKQNSIKCQHCFVDCTNTQYRISTNSMPIYLKGYMNKMFENYSVIQVFFGHSYANMFKQDVIYHWYEIIGSVGGFLGLFLGISVISIFEILYLTVFDYISISVKRKFFNY